MEATGQSFSDGPTYILITTQIFFNIFLLIPLITFKVLVLLFWLEPPVCVVLSFG